MFIFWVKYAYFYCYLITDELNFQIEDPLCKTVDKNLQIPLVNGKVMNIPFSAINISEEVNKTGIWKQVNENNQKKSNKKAEKKNKSPKTPRYYFIFKCILI